MGDQFASIKKLKTELGKWFLSARIFQIHANFKKISDHEIKFLNKFLSVGSRPFLRLSSFQFLISRNYWQNIG